MSKSSTVAIILSVIVIIIVVGILLSIMFTDSGRQELESLIVWTVQEGGSKTTETINPTNNYLYINGSTVTEVTLNSTGNNKGDYFILQSISTNNLTVNRGKGVTFTKPTRSGQYVVRNGTSGVFIWKTDTEIDRLR